MEIEIKNDPEPDKTSRIKTGIQDKIINSTCNKCTLCITTKWCSSTIRTIKRTLSPSPIYLHLPLEIIHLLLEILHLLSEILLLMVTLQTLFQATHLLSCQISNLEETHSCLLKTITLIKAIIQIKVITETWEDETIKRLLWFFNFLYKILSESKIIHIQNYKTTIAYHTKETIKILLLIQREM